jgi:hypothetical protein
MLGITKLDDPYLRVRSFMAPDRCRPSIEGGKLVTSIGFSDQHTELGELRGRTGLGDKKIANLKVSPGSYGAAGQLQQRPSPAGISRSSLGDHLKTGHM